jgi:hypothetical protein
MKKTRGQKSRDTVPLREVVCTHKYKVFVKSFRGGSNVQVFFLSQHLISKTAVAGVTGEKANSCVYNFSGNDWLNNYFYGTTKV